jgi:hypothetical protein
VSFARNERVTRGIKNVTPGAGVAKTVFRNLSKTEEDARIKKVLKWKVDIESEEKAAEDYEEKLEAQKKEMEFLSEEGINEHETRWFKMERVMEWLGQV